MSSVNVLSPAASAPVAVPPPEASLVAAIILAAGMGTRMKSALPKVMHPLLGRPMVQHVTATALQAGVQQLVVVVGPQMEAVAAAVAPCAVALQQDRLGTAHAVLQGETWLGNFAGTVLVLYGDTPLITAETLRRMIALREQEQAGAVVLGFTPADAGAYGRLVVQGDSLEAIVEYKDATPEQRAIRLCNSGVMALDGAALFGWLHRIGNDNANGEYYLTDVVALARQDGRRCLVVEGSEQELMGVNSREELARAEAVAQQQRRSEAMRQGATLIDPATVFFSHDTVIGRDVLVGPFTVFGPGVSVGDGVEIKGFCHLEGCRIGEGAIVGPYARLRPAADIGEGAHIGNFVEVKKTVVEAGAKINHLTYIGDARIGAGSNIGAGTITCNYDGYNKSHTDVGAGAFIGSNSSLVAPVRVGDGAIVGAGSVITGDVEADALAVARGRQEQRSGWAARFRARMTGSKTPA